MVKTEKYNRVIIASIDNMDNLEAAIQSLCSTIFLLSGNIFNLHDAINKIHAAGKKVYIDIDLMDGFAKDSTFLKYVQEVLLPDGIITTKGNLAKKAKSMGVFVIQRSFIFDDMSLQTCINSIQEIKPDVIEILPGLVPVTIRRVREQTRLPVISSGLITSGEDVINALEAGAMAVATCNMELWNDAEFNQADRVRE